MTGSGLRLISAIWPCRIFSDRYMQTGATFLAYDYFPKPESLTSFPEMTAAQKIRVLIVDDHAMVRQGLRAVLQSYPNIEVVGEAANGEEGVASVQKLQPAVIVMDIGMPNLDGIGATRLIKIQYPQIAVVGLSVNAPSFHVDAMLKAGAFEILTKEKAVDELYSAIQRAIAAVQPILILEEKPATAGSAGETKQTEKRAPSDLTTSKEHKR